MNRCQIMSDRMPEVAASGDTWSAEEAAHLLACPDCAAEWRLVAASATLGLHAARNIRPEQLAVGVVARLQAAPVAPVSVRARVRRVVLPLAAAGALVTAVWLGQSSGAPADSPETLVAVLPELDDLDAAELESLAEVFTGTEADPLRPLDAAESFGDLSDAELESLLRLMEG